MVLYPTQKYGINVLTASMKTSMTTFSSYISFSLHMFIMFRGYTRFPQYQLLVYFIAPVLCVTLKNKTNLMCQQTNFVHLSETKWPYYLFYLLLTTKDPSFLQIVKTKHLNSISRVVTETQRRQLYFSKTPPTFPFTILELPLPSYLEQQTAPVCLYYGNYLILVRHPDFSSLPSPALTPHITRVLLPISNSLLYSSWFSSSIPLAPKPPTLVYMKSSSKSTS